MIIKLLATALTGIGGHYLNRRWDKAILFFCLFLFYAVAGNLAILLFSLSRTIPGLLPPLAFLGETAQANRILSLIVWSGLAGLWLASIISTLFDAKKSDAAILPRWTKAGVASALLTTLLSFLMVIGTLLSPFSLTKVKSSRPVSASESAMTSSSAANFYQYLNFGGSSADDAKLPEPETGTGLLKGRISYENKPAAGVSLTMVLNSKYRVRNIVTNAEGVFTVGLPAGPWRINSIQTKSWPGKPDMEKYELYYGGEAKLKGAGYDRHAGMTSNGYAVDIDENAGKLQLNISIKKNIKLLWPTTETKYGTAAVSDAITWEPYPQASKYFIDVKKLRREGTSTYYDEVTSRVVANVSSLPLASLRHVQEKGTGGHEYAVEIYAFSEDGTLLGELPFFNEATFFLTDGNALVEDAVTRPTGDNFQEYVHFGGSSADDRKFPGPPAGNALLKGRMTCENKPAAGVVLDMVLNSKYRVKNIVTNPEGIFTVGLPAGTWKINSIQTTSWPDKPDDESYALYYGGEEKFKGGSYSRFTDFNTSGYPVTVTENDDKLQLNISIKKTIKLLWPGAAARQGTASISDVIKWEKYPGASTYYLEIKKLRREGTTTYFDDVTSRVLSNVSSQPLLSLKHVKTTEKKENEYAVALYAFSEDGTLVGELPSFHEGTFVLADGNALIEDTAGAFMDDSAVIGQEAIQKKMEQIQQNRRRLDAAEALIEDNLLPEAEKIINLIDSEYAQGKKEVLYGFIYALQGNCIKSNELFEKALAVNPRVCIPEKYRAMCKK